MADLSSDPQVTALGRLVPGGVVRRQHPDRSGLRWIEAGAGDPVVLVPGAGEVCLDWATVLPALAADHRVIAYDRPGLGASRQDGRITLASQLDDLTALLEEVGPATLVGHSWGGLLAELVTMQRAGLVRGLVLVDPFREGTLSEVPWRLRVVSHLMLAGIVALKAVGGFRRVAAGMGRTLAEQSTDDAEIQDLLVDAYLASYATLGQVVGIRRENRLSDACTAEVRAIRRASTPPDVPLRFLTAGRGKPPALRQAYDALAAATVREWPAAELVAVPDSGHYVHHDQPEIVVGAVAAVATHRQDPPNWGTRS